MKFCLIASYFQITLMQQNVSSFVHVSAVQTPVLSPPAPAPAPAKKTPAPAENFRLVQICQNWKFLQFKLETPSLFFI